MRAELRIEVKLHQIREKGGKRERERERKVIHRIRRGGAARLLLIGADDIG
jgi:hypothetical protein